MWCGVVRRGVVWCGVVWRSAAGMWIKPKVLAVVAVVAVLDLPGEVVVVAVKHGMTGRAVMRSSVMCCDVVWRAVL